jgi:hypothetical protein
MRTQTRKYGYTLLTGPCQVRSLKVRYFCRIFTEKTWESVSSLRILEKTITLHSCVLEKSVYSCTVLLVTAK